jgi:uncharacterized alkaline shock family protein YloU
MMMKFIFGLAWIGIFSLAISGIYIGMFPNFIEMVNFNDLLTRVLIGGVSLVYVLLFIEKILLVFEKPKELKIKTPNGILRITPNSINNLVKEVVNEHPKVQGLKVTNKSKGKKLKIYVSINIMSSQSLSNDLKDIQKDIKDRVEGYLDLNIADVELRVTKVIKEQSNIRRGV